MKKKLEEMEAQAALVRGRLLRSVLPPSSTRASIETQAGRAAAPSATGAAEATGNADEDAAKQAVQEEVDSRSIFVGNVHYDCQPEDLAEFFKVSQSSIMPIGRQGTWVPMRCPAATPNNPCGHVIIPHLHLSLVQHRNASSCFSPSELWDGDKGDDSDRQRGAFQGIPLFLSLSLYLLVM